LKATEIARAVGGRYEGGADPELSGVAPLDHARASDLALLSSPRYLPDADASSAGAVLVSATLADRLSGEIPRIVVPDTHRALAVLLPLLYPPPPRHAGVHPTAVLGEGVELGDGVSVGAYAVIGAGTRLGDGVVLEPHVTIGRRCRIGPDAYLHPHVTLYDGVQVGARTVLHAGVRLGVDGFGYTQQQGRHVKVAQVGGCEVGDDVEIGANSCVDRGSIGTTVIGNGCKIDNLVHIGHNVRLGEHCIVIAQVGVSGSTRVGRYVTLAGQAGIAGHISIGDGAVVGAQAGVIGNIAAGQTVSGYPARPHRDAMRSLAAVARLPELTKRLRALERAVLGRRTSEE
jgi:UDP-3-O-[3-hydroxymyristoyl] glucosamine N-acyltransferase